MNYKISVEIDQKSIRIIKRELLTVLNEMKQNNPSLLASETEINV